MPNPKHTHNFIQQFHDFTDKYDFINEQIPYIQTNEGQSTPDTWYPATKKVKESLAIRLSLILKSNNTYQIYLENFIKNDEEKWQVHINSLEFKPTCKLDLESILNKWNHQLAIK
jgi:hypothetical protein